MSMEILRMATAGLLLVAAAVYDCGDELDMLWSGERVDTGLEIEGLVSDAGGETDVELET
jgi:hypothetical protein